MPGFRPGKVPKDLYEKRYGDAIIKELAAKRANQALNKFFTEEKHSFLLQPLWTQDNIGETTYKSPTEISVTVMGIVTPKIEIPDGFKVTVPKYNLPPLTEEFLSQHIEDILRDNGAEHIVEKSSQNSIVVGEIQQYVDGEWARWGDFTIFLPRINRFSADNETTSALANGITIGYTVPFKLQDFSVDAYGFASMFDLTPAQLEDFLSKESRFTVTKITEKEIPPITPELQQKITKKTFDSEPEFLDELRKGLEEYYRNRVLNKQKEDEFSAILNALNVQLPEQEIEFVLTATNEKRRITYNALQAALRQLRMSVVVDALREKHPEIELSEEELKESIISGYKSYFGGVVTPDAINKPDSSSTESETLAESSHETSEQPQGLEKTTETTLVEEISENNEKPTDTNFDEIINSLSEQYAHKVLSDDKQREEAFKKISSEKIYTFISTNFFQVEERQLSISDIK